MTERLHVRKLGHRWCVMRSSAPWRPLASFLEWQHAIDTAFALLAPEKTVGGLYVPDGRG